ncbi:MAG TPA: methyl-accepting chemotaxis protein [Abditibacteriaceae bacterium]|jgi:methyl-accepting chemotaxis protein
MLKLAKLKVKTKLSLLIAFFVIGFLAYALLAYNTRSLVQIHGPYYQQILQGKTLSADVTPPAEYILEAFLIVQEMADARNRSELGPDQSRIALKDGLIERGKTLRRDYEDRHAFWVKELPEGELKQTLVVDSYEPAMNFFQIRDGQFAPAVQRGDYKTANALAQGILKQRYREHRAATDEVISLVAAKNSALVQEATDVIASRNVMLTALGLMIGLIALGPGVFMTRSIVAALGRTVNELSTTSTEIAATIEQQERVTHQQSAAVNETTATMDELDASFGQTEEMVRMAAATASEVTTVASQGITTVTQSREGMFSLKDKVSTIAEQILSLSEQTGQISSITTLVGDLANQTNMLALNAAVEAARAGEHGKGFAVIAMEIRKLADESKKSAERINALVADIQKATNSTVMATEEGTKTVETGLRLAEETVAAFKTVTDASNTASGATQQTLLSVAQQVAAVKQVLTAMNALNTSARESSDGISQTKFGVDNLRQTALDLKQMI